MHRIIMVFTLCAVSLCVMAQSFESLKRSKGKTQLYATIEKILAGTCTIEEGHDALLADDPNSPFNGKTPIYIVLDYISTHPKTQCNKAEQVLDILLHRKDVDVNLRYSSLPPPLSYLIRQNWEYLGKRFSSDYISDKVLSLMIEAGANVNTYNQEGGTLMSLAMQTNNTYLQKYLLDKGVNLRHSDKGGNDDVYKLIADGNLEVLKKSIDKGSIRIDINSLKNDTKQLAIFPDMYSYLALHCAKQINKYEDVILFRQRFSDKRDLVQQTYMALAQKETNAASSFSEIETVKKRYPDLEKIYAPKQLSIYRQHVSQLEAAYQKALDAAKNKNEKVVQDACVQSFIDNYSQIIVFDPSKKMSLAKEMADFYAICHALTFSFSDYTGVRYDYAMPWWIEGYSKQDVETIKTAQQFAKKTSNFGFTAFYKYADPKLIERLRQQGDHWRSERKRYNNYYASYESDQARIRASWGSSRSSSSSGSSRSSSSSSSSISSSPSSVDVENVSIPSYKFTTEWQKTTITGTNTAENKSWENQVREIEFDDGTDGKIYRVIGSDGYWAAGDKRYRTINDAIAAEYTYNKYGKRREKGRW